MRTETIKLKVLLGCRHHRVDSGNHLRGVAPGVVAGEQVAFKPLAHKGLRRLEHLWLGAAKAVNTLLRVAHQKHAGRTATPTAGVTAKPREQGLPLQGVGVLKFINEQVLHLGVQALLHPACQHDIAQHDARRPLHIVHVHPALHALEVTVLGDQATRKPRHARLVLPGLVLVDGGHHAQRQVLRITHKGNAHHLFTEFSCCARQGQQSGECIGQIVLR